MWFITKTKRSFVITSFIILVLLPRQVVSTGRHMNICLCVCFSTDVYLWWEASVRLGELSSGWCFWFWCRNGVARVHECSQVLFRLPTVSPSWSFRGCSFPRVHLLLFKAQSFKSLLQASLCRWDLVGVVHFHYMAYVCISISPGVHGRDCCSLQDGVVCLGWLPVFFAFHHTKVIAVSLSPVFLYGVTLLLSSGLRAAW